MIVSWGFCAFSCTRAAESKRASARSDLKPRLLASRSLKSGRSGSRPVLEIPLLQSQQEMPRIHVYPLQGCQSLAQSAASVHSSSLPLIVAACSNAGPSLQSTGPPYHPTHHVLTVEVLKRRAHMADSVGSWQVAALLLGC